MKDADQRPVPGALLRLRKYGPTTALPALILCTAENSYDLSLSGHKRWMTIYSEGVSLPVTARFDSTLQIYTHHLDLPGTEKFIELSTNGADGKNATGTAAAVKGGDGYDMKVYVEELTDQNLEFLEFHAEGGPGGDGNDSAIITTTPGMNYGTAGANGGNGGDIRMVVGSVHAGAIVVGRTLLERRLERGTDEKDARIWFGEHLTTLKKFINLCRNILENAYEDEFYVELCTLEMILAHQWTEYPIDQVRKQVRWILNRLSGSVDELCTGLKRQIYTSGGAYGVGGNGPLNRSASGKNGKDGTINITYRHLMPHLLRKLDMPIAHPDQCSMLLEVAKAHYFRASLTLKDDETSALKKKGKGELEQCYNLLSRLQMRLLFLEGIQTEDPIYRAYKRSEKAMRIMPFSGSNPAQHIPSIAALLEIRREVNLILRQITSQTDYFGHSPGYVPRANHKFYSEGLRDLLENLKVSEEAHLNYFALNSAAQQRQEAVEVMRKYIDRSLTKHKQSLVLLERLMKRQIELSNGLISKTLSARGKLQQALKDVSDYLGSISPSAGLTLTDYLEAATMVTLVPHPVMLGIQAVGLAVKGYAHKGIENDNHEFIKKDLLVDNIKVITGDTTSIVTSYQDIKANGSKFDVDDPKAAKLIVNKGEAMKLFNEFKEKIGASKLTDLESAFQEYIDLVFQRNTAILLYNNSVDTWLQSQETIDYFQEKEASNQLESINDTDPDLPAVALYMERSYIETLKYTLQILYLAHKSLWYYSLSESTSLGDKIAFNPITNVTYNTLKDMQTNLIQDLVAATEFQGKDPQHINGETLRLDAAHLKELCGKGKQTLVRIPTEKNWISSEEFPFRGLRGVRLTKVRFFIYGLRTSNDDFIRVDLTHMGQETIVDQDGNEHDFHHEGVLIHFKHRFADAPNFTENADKTMDGEIGKETGSHYAMVGPFTTWKVEIKPVRKDTEIYLDQVTGAEFKFWGLAF